MAPPDEPTPADPTPFTPLPANPVPEQAAPRHPLPGGSFAPSQASPYGASSSFSSPAYGAAADRSTASYNAPAYASSYPGPVAAPTRARTEASTMSVVAVVLAALALVVGVIALIVGITSLATSAVGALADPYAAGEPFTGFGDAADYGEFSGATEFYGVRSIDDLHEGLCFDAVDLDADLTATVAPLTCDQPHEYEVYATSRLDDDEYPGDGVYDETYPTCEDDFADFVGIGYYDSVVEYGILAPTERAWNEGERDVLCFAFEYSLSRPGTLRDTGE